MPSPGQITYYHPPGGLGVRVDSAVYQGYSVPPYYDSLIGKLIVHGRDRVECLMRLRRALDEFVVDGVRTTIPLFQDLVTEPAIADGAYDIRWLEEFLARPRRRTGLTLSVARQQEHRPRIVTPSLLLRAYACGIFPMADSADDPTLFWVEPQMRGVLPLDASTCRGGSPARSARDRFEIRIDTDFDARDRRAAPRREPAAAQTWINEPIRKLYGELFRMGHVHTVEAWREGRLVGGLYGLKLGAAFFGESMFSDERDASKVALVHLVARLRRGGFKLLDTQFLTEHLAQFGAIEIPRDEYVTLLDEALRGEAEFSGPRRSRGRTGADEALLGCAPSAQSSGTSVRRRQFRLIRARRGRGAGVSGRRAHLQFAVDQPHIVDGVLDGVQAGARGEHPAGEEPLDLVGERDLVDLDEGGGLRRLRRRAGMADARRHLQRAELHRLVDQHVEGDGAAGDLVEAGELGHRIVDRRGATAAAASANAARRKNVQPARSAPSGAAHAGVQGS